MPFSKSPSSNWRTELVEPNPAGGVFDYRTILDTTRKQLTFLEKQGLDNMFDRLNKDYTRMNKIKDRLNEIGTFQPNLVHDEIEIIFDEPHQLEAKELFEELNAIVDKWKGEKDTKNNRVNPLAKKRSEA